jgi:hypothetical protein
MFRRSLPSRKGIYALYSSRQVDDRALINDGDTCTDTSNSVVENGRNSAVC